MSIRVKLEHDTNVSTLALWMTGAIRPDFLVILLFVLIRFLRLIFRFSLFKPGEPVFGLIKGEVAHPEDKGGLADKVERMVSSDDVGKDVADNSVVESESMAGFLVLEGMRWIMRLVSHWPLLFVALRIWRGLPRGAGGNRVSGGNTLPTGAGGGVNWGLSERGGVHITIISKFFQSGYNWSFSTGGVIASTPFDTKSLSTRT